jgi:hypothetical protein
MFLIETVTYNDNRGSVGICLAAVVKVIVGVVIEFSCI